MKYFRYGHMDKVFVKKGDIVRKGDKIATVGNGNGQYKGASHLHLDIPTKKLKTWTSYVFGYSKKKVAEIYADPKEYRKIVAPWFDHFGWEYLQLATYGTRKCYHPGEDLNGKGSGDSDFGLPIYSACDGEVVYCYDGNDSNGGWGKLLVVDKRNDIKETVTVYTDEKQTTSTAPINESVIPVEVELPEPSVEPLESPVTNDTSQMESDTNSSTNETQSANNGSTVTSESSINGFTMDTPKASLKSRILFLLFEKRYFLKKLINKLLDKYINLFRR
jgi:hypothetical protein